MTLDERITFNANQCGEHACIRGMRIRVADILEMLAQGVTEQTILADFPDLEAEDIRACLHFGALRSGIARLAAWADKYDGRIHGTPYRNVTLAMNEPMGVTAC